MKKALIALTILALVASVATAEITLGAWGRTIFVPLQNSGATDEDPTAVITPSWATGGGGRIGFTVAGNSDNVGFQIDIHGDGGKITAGDETKMWVKPMDMLKISVGRVQDDTLRGNAAFGSFNWYRAYAGGVGEDVTFKRTSTGTGGSALYDNKQGVVFNIKPMDSLVFLVALRDVNAQNQAGNNLCENLLKNGQYAAGYTIAGIGQIKAQYIGEAINEKAAVSTTVAAHYAIDQTDGSIDLIPAATTVTPAVEADTFGVFNAAFKLTAVENLSVEIGMFMNTNTDISGKTTEIALSADYKMDALALHAVGIYDLNEDDDGFYLGAGVDYSLAGGIGITGDIRYTNDIKNGGVDARTSFFAGATKGFSNGLIGAGIEVVNSADTGYAVPVRFEYWF